MFRDLHTYTRGFGVSDLYSSKFNFIADFSASFLESLIMSNSEEWVGTLLE